MLLSANLSPTGKQTKPWVGSNSTHVLQPRLHCLGFQGGSDWQVMAVIDRLGQVACARLGQPILVWEAQGFLG